ncbi:putative disease resistance RPP13-like protein 3 [Bidens hawaiensis]|uniref:putative disease resistance RPP13-like protein 3 n=1 Tax=Bidens hawaiensis TaxID=980011 RepID=UPI004049CA7A
MTYTDLEMFMAKLRTLVCETTLFGNNLFIKAKRCQIQWLYEELVIFTGFCIKNKDDLEDVRWDLKRRLMEAVQEAEDTLDMIVSSAIIKNDGIDFILDRDTRGTYLQRTYPVDIDSSLMHVIDDLKSIRRKIMRNNKGYLYQNHVKGNKFEATGTSGNTRVSVKATEHEDLIVGFDDDALLIIDRLTGDRKKLDIVSIVGMGGLGKTTLATKIFKDSLVKYHFDKHGWVTVSQACSKRDLLMQVLASIGKSVHETTGESKLCEILYQSLKRIKYLIVIDDIWSCKAWDDVGLCFPDDSTGSRVLLTTRLTEVALHISQGELSHVLPHLNEDQSWELLRKKTFRGHECPESLVETGKHIAKRCGCHSRTSGERREEERFVGRNCQKRGFIHY